MQVDYGFARSWTRDGPELDMEDYYGEDEPEPDLAVILGHTRRTIDDYPLIDFEDEEW